MVVSADRASIHPLLILLVGPSLTQSIFCILISEVNIFATRAREVALNVLLAFAFAALNFKLFRVDADFQQIGRILGFFVDYFVLHCSVLLIVLLLFMKRNQKR